MGEAARSAADARDGQTARREHILDAAETSFVRNGFHRTTMLDLAKAASMSAGNFYRYFPSKEAIVVGLADRDRERGIAILGELEKTNDRRTVFQGLLAQYFSSMTREAAILRLEIWAETTRNPVIAEMQKRSEAEARIWFVDALTALASSPDCEPEALYVAVSSFMKGIVVERALAAVYDPSPAIARLLDLIDAGLAGTSAGIPRASDRTMS